MALQDHYQLSYHSSYKAPSLIIRPYKTNSNKAQQSTTAYMPALRDHNNRWHKIWLHKPTHQLQKTTWSRLPVGLH